MAGNGPTYDVRLVEIILKVDCNTKETSMFVKSWYCRFTFLSIFWLVIGSDRCTELG